MTIKERAQKALDLKEKMNKLDAQKRALDKEYREHIQYLQDKRGVGEHIIGNVLINFCYVEEKEIPAHTRKAYIKTTQIKGVK